MNLAALPHVLLLSLLLGVSAPMVRRVGRHADTWFLGWLFITCHFGASLFAAGGGQREVIARLISVWTLEFGAICFMRAAGNLPVTWVSIVFTLEMALPLLAQAALMAFAPVNYALRLGTAMLLLTPGIHVILWPEHRSRRRLRFAIMFAVLFPISIACMKVDLANRTAGALTILFMVSSVLYWFKAPHKTMAVFTAAAGLTLWGLTFALQPLVAIWLPQLQMDSFLWTIPQYVVAASMILTLLDEHVSRTERLAMLDPLTGLANRRLFELRLAEAMARMGRPRHNRPSYSVGCVVIDIDNFKTINDSLGHAVGDSLLRALAVRLQWNLGAGDTLARTGGDEFTALVPLLSGRDQLEFLAGAMMSAASVPITVAGQDIAISLSIGVAMFPRDAGDSTALCRAADEAMYRAKRSGGALLAFAGDDC